MRPIAASRFDKAIETMSPALNDALPDTERRATPTPNDALPDTERRATPTPNDAATPTPNDAATRCPLSAVRFSLHKGTGLYGELLWALPEA